MDARQCLAAMTAAMGVGGAWALPPADPPPEPKAATVVAWDPSCAPQYPVAAIKSGAQGTTRVAVHLDEVANVTAGDIVQRSGDTREHRLLDAEAARAIARCPFTAARDGTGKAIASVVTLTQEWHVDGLQASASAR